MSGTPIGRPVEGDIKCCWLVSIPILLMFEGNCPDIGFASAERNWLVSRFGCKCSVGVIENVGFPWPIDTSRSRNSSWDSCLMTGERDRFLEGDLEYERFFSYEEPLDLFSESLEFLFEFDCLWGNVMLVSIEKTLLGSGLLFRLSPNFDGGERG